MLNSPLRASSFLTFTLNSDAFLFCRLQMAFPSGATPSSSPANSPAASSSSIPAFSRQTPRLSKKLTLFVTRATLVTRQADVDFFVRRLFEMPAIVSNSPLVREFFKMRPVDLVQNAPTPTDLVPSTPHNDHDLFAQFLTEKDKSPQATIRSPPPGKGLTASRRPRLGLKYSTPNLRSAYDADEASDVAPLPSPIPETSKLFGRGTIRPGMLPRATTLGLYNGRESFCSASASSISTATPTSAFFSTSPTALDPPPASPTITSSFDEPTPPSSTIKKRPSGPLRHFRSLQDLRHNFSTSSLLPTPPLPTSTGMDRARTQPPLSQSVPQYVPARTTLAGPNSAPSTSRDRSGSRSSIHSLEESLRHGASSRLHGIPETLAQQKRRPSMPLRSTSVATKASCGHSPSSSYDSLRSAGDRNSSLDMSRSFSGHQSGRSSTDLSDVGSQHPATPPTPYSDGRDRDVGGKYYLSDGELTINNKVPLPPFFPVPPSMTSAPMQVSHSYDTYEGMPQHRRTGSDVRSRAGSAASHRPILDTIHASPKLGSPVGSNRSTHPRRLPLVTPLSSPDPSSLTFKIIHTETICLRLSRTITLDALKAQVLAKFAEVAILLDDSFSLASASTPCTTEQEFQSILDSIATLDKLSLRIVSAPLEILA